MSRSAPLFTKPRAGKLSPNKASAKVTAMNPGATRDVMQAADVFFRKRERAEPVRNPNGGRA